MKIDELDEDENDGTALSAKTEKIKANKVMPLDDSANQTDIEGEGKRNIYTDRSVMAADETNMALFTNESPMKEDEGFVTMGPFDKRASALTLLRAEEDDDEETNNYIK